MPTDFASASTRHLRVTHLLTPNEREEAAYLAGYVAECGLKAVAELAAVPGPHWRHGLTKLADEALDLAVVLRPLASRYRPPDGAVTSVRDRWNQDLRYCRTGDHHQIADTIRESARQVWYATVGAMFLDGVLTHFPE